MRKHQPDFVRALRIAPIALGMLIAGCQLAPTYHTPNVPVDASYQDSSPWQVAQPADQLPRTGWWTLYNDPQLNALQQQLLAHNADIAAALAHYQQAQAFNLAAHSELYPQIGAGGTGERERESDTAPLRGATNPVEYNNYQVGLTFQYELDLWGRVRNTVQAGRDDQLAAAADLASAQLSLQAQLADNYVQLRGFDQQVELLQQSIDAYQKALQLTQTRHNGGIASGLDVARAQTQLSSAKSQWAQAQAQRALVEHAIAVLVGASAAQFKLPADTAAISLPMVPDSVPSTLLQRRPDIAAAERRTASANAHIGIARAAYFPSLSLNAQGGFQSAVDSGLLTAPNQYWAIGPSLFMTVFDGGRRKAGVEAARAATDEAGAKYRGVVLNAFAQVEDNLAELDRFGAASVDQTDAANAAQRSQDLAMDRYKHGAVNYLDVVEAQTAALEAKRSLLDLQTRQLRASVQLIRALGGGWSVAELTPKTSPATKAAAP